MESSRVRELIAQLPPGSTYPAIPRRSPFQPARQQPAERFALALRDPAFGASFVDAFIEKRRWLPATVREWPLLQLFLTRVFKVTEPLMLEVESFRTETRRQERDVLDALLLADDITLAEIATWFNTAEQVVEGYATLSWNVRDRKHEPAYLNALLHPAGWQAAVRNSQPNREGDRLRLLQAGAMGGAQAVLELAGFKHSTASDTLAQRRGDFGRGLQADAERRIKAGCRIEDAVVRAAFTATLRQKEQEEDGDPLALHHLNAITPALDEIRKYNGIDGEAPPDYRDATREALANLHPEVKAMLDLTRRGRKETEDYSAPVA
ncbi:MAG: hypothetical protein EBS05_27125 [Proteobacteria bacterium]|nr:hypothetical protein [Pseudomonadota bacterium]